MITLDEASEELVDEAKDLTWSLGVEVALVMLRSGERAFVGGGRDGILFQVREVSSAEVVLLFEGPEASPLEVARLEWHTHPYPTGPSDGDREALRLLAQPTSRVFEFGGEPGGTVFGPDKGYPPGEA